MRFEVEAEIKNLKKMIDNGKMENNKSNNFIEKWDYEDEYSGNEIDEIQADFVYYAKKYLQEHHKGQYAIKHGISNVHIITVEFLNERKLKGWTTC